MVIEVSGGVSEDVIEPVGMLLSLLAMDDLRTGSGCHPGEGKQFS
jgi:hypothetical protein